MVRVKIMKFVKSKKKNRNIEEKTTNYFCPAFVTLHVIRQWTMFEFRK